MFSSATAIDDESRPLAGGRTVILRTRHIGLVPSLIRRFEKSNFPALFLRHLLDGQNFEWPISILRQVHNPSPVRVAIMSNTRGCDPETGITSTIHVPPRLFPSCQAVWRRSNLPARKAASKLADALPVILLKLPGPPARFWSCWSRTAVKRRLSVQAT